jgi:hypothetical protein
MYIAKRRNERVLRKYLRERARAAGDARDLALLNRSADRHNAEAADVLTYQKLPE